MTSVTGHVEAAAEAREPVTDNQPGQGALANHVLWWAWYLPADLARTYWRRWGRGRW